MYSLKQLIENSHCRRHILIIPSDVHLMSNTWVHHPDPLHPTRIMHRHPSIIHHTYPQHHHHHHHEPSSAKTTAPFLPPKSLPRVNSPPHHAPPHHLHRRPPLSLLLRSPRPLHHVRDAKPRAPTGRPHCPVGRFSNQLRGE